MAMRVYPSIAAAADDAREFFYTTKADLPAHVVARIEPHVKHGSSPVDLIVAFTEATFANQADLPKEAKEIAAGLANLIDTDGYHGRLDGRAAAISFALRRESGEKAGEGRAWPKKADDPAPKIEYLKPDEAAALAVPAAGNA